LATVVRPWWISLSFVHFATTVMMSPLAKVLFPHLHPPCRHIEEYRRIVIIEVCFREIRQSDVSDLIEACPRCQAAVMKGCLT
jgi:hypothetical protein